MKALDKFGQARDVPSKAYALDHGMAPIEDVRPSDPDIVPTWDLEVPPADPVLDGPEDPFEIDIEPQEENPLGPDRLEDLDG